MRSIRLNRLEAQLAMLFVAGILSYTTIGTLHALQLQIWTGFSTDVMASGIVEGPPRQQELDLGWYAPSRTAINDLERVVEEKGVYGFIYNSSRIPDDLPYSTYNWCNMPHVRRTEYIIPPARYKLDYVEVVCAQSLLGTWLLNSADSQASQADPVCRKLLSGRSIRLGLRRRSTLSLWKSESGPSVGAYILERICLIVESICCCWMAGNLSFPSDHRRGSAGLLAAWKRHI